MVNLGRYKHGHLLDGVEHENDLSRVLFTIFNQLFISQKFTTLNNLEMNSNYLYQVFTPYIRRAGLYTRKQFAKTLSKNSQFATAYLQFGARLSNLANLHQVSIDVEYILFNIQGSIFLENTDPNSIYLLFNRNKYFSLTLKKYLPTIYEALYTSVVKLREDLALPLNEDRINYLLFTLVTGWTNLILDVKSQIDKVSILIISNRHKTHSEMIKNILDQELHRVSKMDVYTDVFINQDRLEELDYDLIISNFPLPKLSDKQTMIIEHFPVRDDIAEIERVIQSIIVYKNQQSDQPRDILLDFL